jgi:RNA polymerase sigma factor (sigma-70 family)
MYQADPFALPQYVDTMGTMTHESAAATVEPTRWERAAALFLRWRAGDARAMDELVRLMTPLLWHVVRAYGLDSALAEDVVQTTWLTLVRRHESITEPQAVSGWLTMVARREAWRVGKLHRRADPTEAESLEVHLPAQESAEQTAATDDESRRLWFAVAQLNDRCQRLLRIVAFEERPDYARIAQDMAMPIGSIGPTRQRCLGKLRTLIESDGWGGDSNGD